MIKSVSWVTFALFFATARSEIFSAVVDLEQVVDAEGHLIDTLEDFIKADEKKLEILKGYAEVYKTQHRKALENVQLYVTNPINAYTLIKRLTTDWRVVENMISTNLSADYMANINYIKEKMTFPSDEDLFGAADGLSRLQDTYRLDTSSLARGEINGVKYTSELTADDCFEIGRQAYKVGDYCYTQLWMREAYARLKNEANATIDKSDILYYLAWSAHEEGNISLALDLTHKILKISPNHSRALENKIYYENDLQNSISDKRKNDECKNIVEGIYEKLCRKEISLSEEKQAKLKCRYLNRNNPFLLLAPFKVEEAHHNPDILIFHDVLFDNEIATLKKLALPRFERAGVIKYGTADTIISNSRVGKDGFIKKGEFKHINQRISDMTGLTMTTAECLDVINYGIGGHYVPHFDHALKHEVDFLKSLETGNRIATVLFYLSDVEQGGATVFPRLNVSVSPKKGTATFWYNLHPSGDGDQRSLHAGCPVLIGSKWVATKWIHEEGQVFLRPCTLERPSEDLIN